MLFAAGSGDVSGSLTSWGRSGTDNRVVALAYSLDLFSIAQSEDWRLFCFANYESQPARIGQTAVLPLLKPSGSSALNFHLNDLRYGMSIARIARRVKADVVIVATGLTAMGYLAVSSCKKPLVLSLHNTLWARGQGGLTGLRKWTEPLAGKLLRKRLSHLVAVSREIARQTQATWGVPEEHTSVHVPQYDVASMPWTPAPTETPHRVLFAGRVESYKGTDDIIDAAAIVNESHPGLVKWVIAGDGCALAPLKQAVVARGLGHVFDFTGQLERTALIEQIKRCYITLTPTRTSFNEGLAKLPIEGALMGRPAVASSAVPALDLLSEAGEETAPGDGCSIAAAVIRLCEDRKFYERRRQACEPMRSLTSDENQSFRQRIQAAIDQALRSARRA